MYDVNNIFMNNKLLQNATIIQHNISDKSSRLLTKQTHVVIFYALSVTLNTDYGYLI